MYFFLLPLQLDSRDNAHGVEKYDREHEETSTIIHDVGATDGGKCLRH